MCHRNAVARRTRVLLGALLVGACREGSSPVDREPVDTGPHVATDAELVSPATFDVPAGDSAVLTVAVRVRDERGRPLPGAEVLWEGAVLPQRMLTDTIGEARAQWYVNGKEPFNAQAAARVVTTKGEVRIVFVATVKNGPLVAATVLRADTLPNPTGIVVEVGQAARFTTYGPDAAGHYLRDVPATWSSADPARATVDQNGVVTGRAQGYVRIDAAIAGLAGPVWGPALIVDPLRARAVGVAIGVSCAAQPAGSVVCWGQGYTPPVPSRDSVVEPVPVAPELRLATMSPGGLCGLTSEGAAYCLGTAGNAPTRILPGVSLRALAAGSGLACGLDAAGAAFCQGTGQVQRIAARVPFSAIASSANNACGAATDGVYCWSADTPGSFTAATRLPGSTAATDVAMSGPSGFVCAVDPAGAARCTYAALSSVDSSWRAVLTSRPVARLALGENAICGISRDARLLCVVVEMQVEYTRERRAPDGSGWAAVSFTNYTGNASPFIPVQTHACGVTGEGRTYCWGYNTSGELGITSEGSCSFSFTQYACSGTPLPVPSPRPSAAVALPR